MGRPRKYTPARLKAQVDQYFASITRKRKITETVVTEELDQFGHQKKITVPVKNQLGQEVEVTEYIIPPDVAGLCDFLKIHPSTWALYADHEKHPEFREITELVYDRMKAWNEREILTRPGKDIAGIKFNLENNYGYRDRTDVRISGGVDEFLRRLAEEGAESEL